MNCSAKLHHGTEREALNHLARARQNGNGGHGIKYLNVYPCPCGQGWCVGRSYRSKREALAAQPAAPEPKQPTAGQLRRAAKKAAEKQAKQQMYQDYHDTLVFCRQLTDQRMAELVALGAKPRAVPKD